MIKRIFAFLVLAITALTAAAADVYISDFSIKAGETKMIDVNFDSDRTDLKRFMGTITMPAGLTVLNQGTTTNYLWMTPDATRTNGGMGNYNYTTGQIAIYAIGTTFNAGTGAIAHLQVMATTDLADVSTITLSNFTGTTTSNETVNLTSQNCTVTREAGTDGDRRPGLLLQSLDADHDGRRGEAGGGADGQRHDLYRHDGRPGGLHRPDHPERHEGQPSDRLAVQPG